MLEHVKVFFMCILGVPITLAWIGVSSETSAKIGFGIFLFYLFCLLASDLMSFIYFIKSIFKGDLEAGNYNHKKYQKKINGMAYLNTPHTPSIDSMSGIEYEEHCENILILAGWKCKKTAITGDQGLDILATKPGCITAIQCKKSLGSVGNSAVQEVYSARAFYDANYAVVISNGSFTRSAIELACKLNVFLISHSDINSLESRIRSRGIL